MRENVRGKFLVRCSFFKKKKLSKHFSYGRYRRLNCEKSDSVTCRRLQRVYARRCSLRCHDLRTKAADCPGSHVKCFLQFARHLQAQKCSIVGTGRRDLPQPPSTSSSGTRNPDDDDDDEEDSGSFGGRAFGGSSSSSFQSNSSVSNVNSTSTNNGTLTARSASNSSAPGQDNTLFYVLIALMAALIFLVIVGIALMCIWWQPKSNSNYVEVEEDHKSSSSAF
jgi:hypothetical protein